VLIIYLWVAQLVAVFGHKVKIGLVLLQRICNIFFIILLNSQV